MQDTIRTMCILMAICVAVGAPMAPIESGARVASSGIVFAVLAIALREEPKK